MYDVQHKPPNKYTTGRQPSWYHGPRVADRRHTSKNTRKHASKKNSPVTDTCPHTHRACQTWHYARAVRMSLLTLNKAHLDGLFQNDVSLAQHSLTIHEPVQIFSLSFGLFVGRVATVFCILGHLRVPVPGTRCGWPIWPMTRCITSCYGASRGWA